MSKRKQNRCIDHQQQIVALCIDEGCKQPLKAVCPLQLYSDHLDHKFENISKIHSEWGLFEKDMKDIMLNISQEVVVKYMDSIIEELLFKIKEHLFLVRKEFEGKLAVYFEGKAVQKIRSAMSGIKKCIDERFLDLKHNEIQQAKFFVEIYGMKKLLNDTRIQKENFEKEILIAFAKLKEEMFMDYPKFSALVRAKEYEHCEIIKNQKAELIALREKVSKMEDGYEKTMKHNKQLEYELQRTSNQLRNKDMELGDTEEKLRHITKKRKQQEEEAIRRAQKVKTKNIFGPYCSKLLFRVSDRVIRTGDNQLEWPNFVDVGEATDKIYVRINRFGVGSWVLLGVMFRNQIERNQYQFDNYKKIAHGAYLLDNNRWCYSDNHESFNCKPLGFEFGHHDIIKVEVFNKVIRFSKWLNEKEEGDKFELPYQRLKNQPMSFCVALKGQHTEVELV